MIRHPLILLYLATLSVSASGQTAMEADPDVALGKAYTLSPTPNYALTADAGDAVQLTDGVRAGGRFWTDKRSVGWSGARPVIITVDLGAEYELTGASFSTAAGTRGDVSWPETILVLGSADGQSYVLLGDLKELEPVTHRAPGRGIFSRHVFAARELVGQARFVRFMVGATGSYVFVDEVEVFGRPAVASHAVRNATTDTNALFWRAHAAPRLRGEVERQLADATARLGAFLPPSEERSSLAGALDGLARRAAAMTLDDWARASETYPMNELHTAALAVIGRLEELSGTPGLRAWPTTPWDPLDLTSGPELSNAKVVAVAAMNGEVRSAALNLRNSTGSPMEVTLSLAGVEALEPGWIEASSVAWTGDAAGRPVALAILPPSRGATVAAAVPAGVTQQFWLTFSPRRIAPGVYHFLIRAASPGNPPIDLPVKVEILHGQFPPKPRLHVGGWDYLNEGGVKATPAIRASIAGLLTRFGVDLQWATAAAMPFGTYDAEGHMLVAPRTDVFDAWVALWPHGFRYRVYLAARDDIGGLLRGTPEFNAAVAAWATFWGRHAATRGISPDSVELLFVDEPRGAEQSERQVAWASALASARSGLRAWADPNFADPSQTPVELARTADAICVNRRLLERSLPPHRTFIGRVHDFGKTVELYGTEGPASQQDPYAYYRLQAWRAFDLGATGSSFWSFSDDGGASAFREYVSPRVAYSPLFLTGSTALPSKHLYAIREGTEDFEYLAMLRHAIERAAAGSAADAAWARAARARLAALVTGVLGSARLDALVWNVRRDRAAADAARMEIAGLLAQRPPALAGDR